MPFTKLNGFTKLIASLADRPNLTATDLKAYWDQSPEELRVALNGLIDQLQSIAAGSSGAKNIGATAIAGLTGTDIQTLLESIKTFVDNIAGSGRTNETVKGNADALATHKASTDHDGRYFTQTQINAIKDDLAGVGRTTETIKGVDSALATHKGSNDHDSRYYQKTETYSAAEVDLKVRGVDTTIKYEVFTIVNSNNGNGTFTYKDKSNVNITGALTTEGYQTFTLQSGTYITGQNKIEASINDTLQRSAASGGLREDSSTAVTLTMPEGANAEVTFKYFETIAATGTQSRPIIANTAPTASAIGTLWIDTSF